ncbi:MAG: methionine gamma-lyase family protein [Firmicutes bacterium]|nr:methionine gamma-lyase family protein [Bacillota bacterium]
MTLTEQQQQLIAAADAAGRAAMQAYEPYAAAIAEKNTARALDAFRAERISVQHFASTNGYGYGDMGRDKLEELYARIFGTEAALTRQNIVSGSHAISLALCGNLLPGDHLVCLGIPYDTLQTVIGLNKVTPGCLVEMGVRATVQEIDFEHIDAEAIVAELPEDTKMVALQRSRGYSSRPAMTVAEIAAITAAVHQRLPQAIVFVDNCYGEMMEETEPTHHGVDLMCGSLIKNPGAGLTPSGGYVVGREDLVDRAAYRLTFAGAGREIGASLIDHRLFYQALFMSPTTVLEATLGAVYAAAFMQHLGFEVSPAVDAKRSDIIQMAYMGNAERLIEFCRGIQRYSPVDSFAAPEPWPMPGYDNDIIMAAGCFVAGASIELSADAPLREPYLVFMQGGLNRWHMPYALQRTAADMMEKGLI